MTASVVLVSLFVVFIVALLLIARWSVRSQARMFREDAERRREMYER